MHKVSMAAFAAALIAVHVGFSAGSALETEPHVQGYTMAGILPDAPIAATPSGAGTDPSSEPEVRRWSAGRNHANAAEPHHSPHVRPLGAPDECGYCAEYENVFGWFHHFTTEGGYMRRDGAFEEGEHEDGDTLSLRCSTHAWCWLEEQPIAADLKRIVASEDTHSLLATLASSSSRVTYNPTRSALQLRGCNGGIVAHVPLRGEALEVVRGHYTHHPQSLRDIQDPRRSP